MLVGVYTGGTPNLVSLKVALGVDPNLFVMTSTYDMIVGAITIIFFITIGPKIFRAYLASVQTCMVKVKLQMR